jgi:hypothetical protein
VGMRLCAERFVQRTLLNPSDGWTYNTSLIYSLHRRLGDKAVNHFDVTDSLVLWPHD